jgi:hypothetical protein
VRNRLSKLIGKVAPPADPADSLPALPPKRKRAPNPKGSKNSSLFRDYTYIRLHSKSGKVSQLFSFACFRDERVY